jgi:hypothetical protein
MKNIVYDDRELDIERYLIWVKGNKNQIINLNRLIIFSIIQNYI